MALIAIIGLSACEAPQGTAAALPSGGIAGEVGPGPQRFRNTDATKLAITFDNVCGKTLGRRQAAEAELVRMGFRPRPETGTWYDNKQDLSFKLQRLEGREVCSMVFAMTGPSFDTSAASILIAGVQAAGTVAISEEEGGAISGTAPAKNGGTVNVIPTSRSGDLTYFRAAIFR